MQENQIIILEQLPIIVEKLDNVSKEVKEKVAKATSLVVTEDSVKEVKQVRANLTKEFNELETQRKNIKNAIMEKYNAFEEVYRKKISDLYKEADAQLKAKIDNVENQLKLEKEVELREFVQQHCDSRNIHIDFKSIGLNITLSASMKSLKEQALAFIEKVESDLKLIELEEYKDEILLEYNKTFDFTMAKLDVIARHKQLEEIKKQQELKEQQEKEEQQVVEKVDEVVEDYITIPKEILDEEDLITVTFTITDTKENIIKVREFMKENNIKYE